MRIPVLSCCVSLGVILTTGLPASAQQVTGSAMTTASSVPEPAVQPVSPLPSLSQVFTGAVRDLRSLPSRDNLKWFAIGAGVALASRSQDRHVTATLHSSAELKQAFASGSTLGGMPVQFGSALGAFTIGRVSHSARVTTFGSDLMRAQLVAQTVSYGLKYSLRRSRPDGTSFSFPSGHTATSFASAAVVQRHFGWQAGVPAYAVAAYIGASRMQAQRHYLSDVAFGAAIGIVAARTVTVGRGDARFALTPAATPGGAGVAFTWIGKH